MVTGKVQDKVSLGEGASHYLATLPEDNRSINRQEIHNFVRWYGWDRDFSGLGASEVSKYAERLAQADADSSARMRIVKAFLNYANKEGWSRENLAIGLKISPGKNKPARSSVRKVGVEPVPMNQSRFDEMTAELASLKTRRIEVIGDVQRAAADKDFKENAPFHAAREQKSLIEGKIMEIEQTLERVVITENSHEISQTISIGDTLILQETLSQTEMRCTIVNPKEVEPSKGKISAASPVGKASLGKREGETITVAVPSGKRQYLIKCIER